jgi:hypothetical protein
MGLFSNIRGALDSARAAKVEKANAAVSGGGKRGKHRKPAVDLCPYTWKDKGIPGSKHATYPHENHACGSGKHNRGNHFCREWDCGATHP